MSSGKTRKFIYLTPDDKERLEARTAELLMNASAYIAELIMWDSQLKLVENCRVGNIQKVIESEKRQRSGRPDIEKGLPINGAT